MIWVVMEAVRYECGAATGRQLGLLSILSSYVVDIVCVAPQCAVTEAVVPRSSRWRNCALVQRSYTLVYQRPPRRDYITIGAFEPSDATRASEGRSDVTGEAESTTGFAFPIAVSMDQNGITDGDKKVQVTPGTVVAVGVKTGKRRIMEYPWIRPL